MKEDLVMKRLLPLIITIVLTVSLLGGCAMKPAVDTSLIKDDLLVPSEYLESGYFPDMQAALEKGLVLEPVDFTYIADISGDPPPLGWDHTQMPGESPLLPREGFTEERILQVPDEYFYTLQAYYRKAFEVYLLQTTRLDLIEKEIEEAGLDFRQVRYEKMSRLERLSNLDLKHMYICIPMRIEQLSQADADELKRLYAENGSEITKEALEFVKRTYPTVIREAVFDGVSYPLQTASGISWNPESLVISFTMPRVYDEEGNPAEDKTAPGEREQFLLEKLPLYWKEMQGLLDAPLTFVVERQGGSYLYTITNEVH